MCNSFAWPARPGGTVVNRVAVYRDTTGARFAGILIEHYAGRFPVWLAPVQATVLPVSDRHNEYAEKGAAFGLIRKV